MQNLINEEDFICFDPDNQIYTDLLNCHAFTDLYAIAIFLKEINANADKLP